MKKTIRVRNLFMCYKNIENYLPQEILNLVCGNKFYDKKYLKIKEFFKNYIIQKMIITT
jgi:hypothetical protein